MKSKSLLGLSVAILLVLSGAVVYHYTCPVDETTISSKGVTSIKKQTRTVDGVKYTTYKSENGLYSNYHKIVDVSSHQKGEVSTDDSSFTGKPIKVEEILNFQSIIISDVNKKDNEEFLERMLRFEFNNVKDNFGGSQSADFFLTLKETDMAYDQGKALINENMSFFKKFKEIKNVYFLENPDQEKYQDLIVIEFDQERSIDWIMNDLYNAFLNKSSTGSQDLIDAVFLDTGNTMDKSKTHLISISIIDGREKGEKLMRVSTNNGDSWRKVSRFIFDTGRKIEITHE